MFTYFLKTAGNAYCAHFRFNKPYDHYLFGTVYEILNYLDENGNFDGPPVYRGFDKDGVEQEYDSPNEFCEVLYHFTLVSKGVWDGRISFPSDNEYYREQIGDIDETWKQLFPILKSKIQEKHPEYIWED